MPRAVTTLENESGQIQRAEAPAQENAVLNMIERAIRDPAVDVDKLERMMKMRREMLAEEAERHFNVAMRAAQAEMRPISADAANPQTRSRYASYAKLDRVLRPIYTRHGFALSFDEADSPKPDHVRIICYVSHESGHTRTYRKDMPADGKGAKGGDVMTKTHATGAAASYGARYLLKGIFNVAVGEEDRDGNEPADARTITPAQVETLQDLIIEVGANPVAFLAFLRSKNAAIQSLADIPLEDFAEIRNLIELKRKKESRQ